MATKKGGSDIGARQHGELLDDERLGNELLDNNDATVLPAFDRLDLRRRLGMRPENRVGGCADGHHQG